jgi:hypothetical protein
VRTVCESLRILCARVFWRKAHVDIIAAPAGDASLHRGKVRAPSGCGGGVWGGCACVWTTSLTRVAHVGGTARSVCVYHAECWTDEIGTARAGQHRTRTPGLSGHAAVTVRRHGGAPVLHGP